MDETQRKQTADETQDPTPPQEELPEEERDTASGGPADPPKHDA
jgi:hypothetical protein